MPDKLGLPPVILRGKGKAGKAGRMNAPPKSSIVVEENKGHRVMLESPKLQQKFHTHILVQ